MDRDIVNALMVRANRVALHVAELPIENNEWGGYTEAEGLNWEVTAPGDIRFTRKNNPQYTGMHFTKVTPVEVTKEVWEPAKILNSNPIDSSAFDIFNDSSEEVTQIYTFKQSQTTTKEEEYGLNVSLGLVQKIGYGNEFVKGETTFSVQIDNSYKKRWGSENTTERTQTIEIPVGGKKKVTVTNSVNLSRVEQTANYIADLEHGIHVWAGPRAKAQLTNDYYHDEWKFASCDEFREVLSGTAPSNYAWSHLFKKYPAEEWKQYLICPKIDAEFDYKRKFDQAQTGSVRITESDIVAED